jgi:hypothetical protein
VPMRQPQAQAQTGPSLGGGRVQTMGPRSQVLTSLPSRQPQQLMGPAGPALPFASFAASGGHDRCSSSSSSAYPGQSRRMWHPPPTMPAAAVSHRPAADWMTSRPQPNVAPTSSARRQHPHPQPQLQPQRQPQQSSAKRKAPPMTTTTATLPQPFSTLAGLAMCAGAMQPGHSRSATASRGTTPPSLKPPAPFQQHSPQTQRPGPSIASARSQPSYWDYFAADDETPRQICEKLGGIDVCELLLLNKGRYKGLHANARLLHGTQLLIPTNGDSTVPTKKMRMESAQRAPNAQPSSSAVPKPRLVLRQSSGGAAPAGFSSSTGGSRSKKVKAAAAAALPKSGPSIQTEVGVIRLHDSIFVRWTDGDGQFYAATVTNVSPSRGLTVKYPESKDWDAWTEVLPITSITADRVQFKRGARPPPVSSSSSSAASASSSVAAAAAPGAHEAPGASTEHFQPPAAPTRVASASWTDAEDTKLIELVDKDGEGEWPAKAALLGTKRTAKACQTRYRNHLRFRQPRSGTVAGASSDKRQAAVGKTAVTGGRSNEHKRSKPSPPSPSLKLEPVAAATEESTTNQRRSSRAAAQKQVSYNVDEAFKRMETSLESPLPSPAQSGHAAARGKSRGRGSKRSFALSSDDEEEDQEEDQEEEGASVDSPAADGQRGDKVGAEKAEPVAQETQQQSGGPGLISEAELERLRRQQLRWVRQQEQREREEAARRAKQAQQEQARLDEQARQNKRQEAHRKREDAKEQRRLAENARRESLQADRRRQQAEIDRGLLEDEVKLRAIAEGQSKALSADGTTEDCASDAASEKLKSKQRSLMRLMKQLKVDAKPKLLEVTRTTDSPTGPSSVVGPAPRRQSSAPPDKFSPEASAAAPQWKRSATGPAASPKPQSVPAGGDDSDGDTSVGAAAKKSVFANVTPQMVSVLPGQWDALLGCRMQKTFASHGTHQGTVSGYAHDSVPRLYTVRYDDGDEEDLEQQELLPLLTSAPQAQPPCMQRQPSDDPSSSLPPVGCPLQYKLSFQSRSKHGKKEHSEIWMRGVVKRRCKGQHTTWVHVLFDDKSNLDVQVLSASRGTVWCLPPSAAHTPPPASSTGATAGITSAA